MKKFTALVLFAVLFSTLFSSVFAAGYIKIGDIKGEAIDKSNATEVGPIRWMAPERMEEHNIF